MAGESLTARFSLLSQLWFRWTEKCLETATSHMQTVNTITKNHKKNRFSQAKTVSINILVAI